MTSWVITMILERDPADSPCPFASSDSAQFVVTSHSASTQLDHLGGVGRGRVLMLAQAEGCEMLRARGLMGRWGWVEMCEGDCDLQNLGICP